MEKKKENKKALFAFNLLMMALLIAFQLCLQSFDKKRYLLAVVMFIAVIIPWTMIATKFQRGFEVKG